MIITLSGLPGSGKTTVGKILAQKLQIPWYSVGDLRGKMAQERGMTIDEFNALGEKEDFTDKEVDAYQTELGKSGKDFVIDGWMSWHFIPHSLKVFLEVDPKEAAGRIFIASQKQERPDEKPYTSATEVEATLAQRVKNSAGRYQKYYGMDFLNRSHYDLVIDTTNLTPEQVAQRILEAQGATATA